MLHFAAILNIEITGGVCYYMITARNEKEKQESKEK